MLNLSTCVCTFFQFELFLVSCIFYESRIHIASFMVLCLYFFIFCTFLMFNVIFSLFSQNFSELLQTVLLYVLPDQFIITKRNVDIVLTIHRCAKDIWRNKSHYYFYLNTFTELRKKQEEEDKPVSPSPSLIFITCCSHRCSRPSPAERQIKKHVCFMF